MASERKDSFRKVVVSYLEDVGLSTCKEIAEATGLSVRTVQRHIRKRLDEHLYEPQPGIDARALDAALGGYTYARKPAATI